jgi:Zn-dependent peptidase ImmA (M78 family)/transcriptional regulator with XRE-family HTH domain
MITPEELGKRLRQARERVGLKQDDAAAALRLDATAIAKIEHGKRGVGALEIVRLATLYKVSMSDLLANAVERADIRLRIAMRQGTALDPKAEAMQHRLEQIIADDRWLRLQLKQSTDTMLLAPVAASLPPNMPAHERGYRGAELFRGRYGLAASPISDTSVLADEVGVIVACLPLGIHQAPDGCSAFDPLDETAYILINSDKPRFRRRFTIAHELGHLSLGHLHEGEMVLDGLIQMAQPHEVEANAFAAGLLMPEQGVKASLERLRARLGAKAEPLEWAVWLSASFGVSEEAAAYRMINLDLPEAFNGTIVDAVKSAQENPDVLRQTRARLGLAPVMSDAEKGISEVGPVMRARIVRALEEGLVSIERAAEMMHVPTYETYRWIVETRLHVSDSGRSA